MEIGEKMPSCVYGHAKVGYISGKLWKFNKLHFLMTFLNQNDRQNPNWIISGGEKRKLQLSFVSSNLLQLISIFINVSNKI